LAQQSGGRVFQSSPTGSAQDIHRAPPHSVEAEQGVLGSMLIAPQDVIPECVEKIKEEYFYIPAHQRSFAFGATMERGARQSISSPSPNLARPNVLETIGGASFVTSLFTFVPTAANVDYYLEIVRDKFVLREIILTCTEGVRTRLRGTRRSGGRFSMK